MVAAKETFCKKIDVSGKRAIIRKNRVTQEMIAGFLDPVSGMFDEVARLDDEKDIDNFLAEYDLSVVMISNM